MRRNILDRLGDMKLKKGADAVAVIRDLASDIQDQIRAGRELADKIDDPDQKQAM